MADNEQVVNGIVMPPLYNQRAGQMWDIISAHVDFVGKRVIDLGCGHGDLLVRAYAAGAIQCIGYDRDYRVENDFLSNVRAVNGEWEISFVLADIAKSPIMRFNQVGGQPVDIFFCCSVLPYLENADIWAEWFAHDASLSIIECQYAGDGPGFDFIKDDADMEKWLRSAGWSTVTAIGKTHVVERDKWRTIWMCEQ